MATVNFGPSDAAPPAGRFTVGEQLVVATDMLNIRENPSLRGPITATLPYMAAATVTDGPMPANGYSWYRIDTDHGSGWSAEQYLSHADALNPVARFRVGESVQVDDPEGLKLRSAPSITASQVASMSPGVSGTVVDGPKAADGYIWMQIRTSAGTGWCVEDFLTYGADSAPDPAKFAEGDRVVVDTDALNLRETPGATGPVLVSLGTGVGGTVIAGPEFANNMAWYKLETEYGTGWSAGSFLTLASEASTERQFDPGQRVYVSTDALNLRTAPGTGSSVVAVLLTYTTASIVDGPVEKDGYIWYQIDSDQGAGWSAAQFLAKGTADPATSGFGMNDTVYVNTDALNLRASASLSGGVVTTLTTDQDATIIGAAVDADGFTWVKVRAGSHEGWCVTAYLAKAKGASPRPGGRARVIDGELNLRAAASTGSDIIAVLPDATFVDVLEGPVGGDAYDWFRVSTSRFGTGWCAGQYLEVV